MSSILTALQKLENNGFHKEEVGILSRNTSFRHNKSFKAFVGLSPFGFNLLVFVLILILILVAGIMILRYHENKFSNPINPMAQKQATDNMPAIQPVKPVKSANDRTLTEINAKTHVQIHTSSNSPLPIPRQIKLPLNPKAINTQVPEDLVSTSLKPEILKMNSVVEKPKQKAPTPPIPTQMPAIRENPSPAQIEIENTTPPPGHEKLALQAIAWAKEPANRMAVINGEVVRQGNAINGTMINLINENDVVLKKGAYTWKLLFTVR